MTESKYRQLNFRHLNPIEKDGAFKSERTLRTAKHYNPIIRVFCQRLLAAGLRPLQVVGAAMHKLLHLIYGILKSGKPFDPNFLEKKQIAT